LEGVVVGTKIDVRLALIRKVLGQVGEVASQPFLVDSHLITLAVGNTTKGSKFAFKSVRAGTMRLGSSHSFADLGTMDCGRRCQLGLEAGSCVSQAYVGSRSPFCSVCSLLQHPSLCKHFVQIVLARVKRDCQSLRFCPSFVEFRRRGALVFQRRFFQLGDCSVLLGSLGVEPVQSSSNRLGLLHAELFHRADIAGDVGSKALHRGPRSVSKVGHF
jgi:hypothetical protein